jgi:phage baseplate assembly protein gpV
MISIPERLAVDNEGIKKAFDNFAFGLRCASPGIIESFNAEKQTAQVRIAITERIRINGAISTEIIPLLVDVPVCFPTAGGFSLTVPVKAQDECLVVFSDTCFDAWYQSGGIQNQMSLRRHDLSDAFAIVGINSQPNKLPNYSVGSIQLRNDAGTNYIEISEDRIYGVYSPGQASVEMTSSEITIMFGATKIVLDASGITCTGNVLMNNNLEVLGQTILTEATTIQGETFAGHEHLPGDGDGHTGGVVMEGN